MNKRYLLIFILVICLNVSLVHAEEFASQPDVNVYVDMDSVIDELVKLEEQVKEIQTEIDDNEQYLVSNSRYTILSFLVMSIIGGYIIGFSIGNNKMG